MGKRKVSEQVKPPSLTAPPASSSASGSAPSSPQTTPFTYSSSIRSFATWPPVQSKVDKQTGQSTFVHDHSSRKLVSFKDMDKEFVKKLRERSHGEMEKRERLGQKVTALKKRIDQWVDECDELLGTIEDMVKETNELEKRPELVTEKKRTSERPSLDDTKIYNHMQSNADKLRSEITAFRRKMDATQQQHFRIREQLDEDYKRQVQGLKDGKKLAEKELRISQKQVMELNDKIVSGQRKMEGLKKQVQDRGMAKRRLVLEGNKLKDQKRNAEMKLQSARDKMEIQKRSANDEIIQSSRKMEDGRRVMRRVSCLLNDLAQATGVSERINGEHDVDGVGSQTELVMKELQAKYLQVNEELMRLSAYLRTLLVSFAILCATAFAAYFINQWYY